MEANELRINNYVNAHLYGEMPIMVQSVCAHEETIYNSYTGEIKLHSLTGIKLTENWLLDFGFLDNGVAFEMQIPLDNGSQFYSFESTEGFFCRYKRFSITNKICSRIAEHIFLFNSKRTKSNKPMTWNEFKELKEGQYVFNDYLGYVKVVHKYKNYIISDDSNDRLNWKDIEFKDSSNHFLSLIDDYEKRIEVLDYENYEYPKFDQIEFFKVSEDDSFDKLMLSRIFRNGEGICLNCLGLGYHSRETKCDICNGLGIRKH